MYMTCIISIDSKMKMLHLTYSLACSFPPLIFLFFHGLWYGIVYAVYICVTSALKIQSKSFTRLYGRYDWYM